MCMIVAKCIHGFYSIMHDKCYTYMHALHYSYGRMQCINTRVDLFVPSLSLVLALALCVIVIVSLRSSRVIGDSFPEFGHIDSWK